LKKFVTFLLTLGLFALAVFLTAQFLLRQDSVENFSLLQSPRIAEVDLGDGLEKVKIETNQFLSSPLSIAYTDSPTYLSVPGILRWTNKHRDSEALHKLTLNQTLNQVAAAKVADMFENNYFEHVSPDGVGPGDLAREYEYDFIVVGENLAKGNFKTDKKLVQAWMDSPGHRENIMKSAFTEIGIAVGQTTDGGREVWLAVQSFGTPKSNCGEPEDPSQLEGFRDAIQRDIEDLEAYKQEIEALQQQLTDPDSINSEITNYNERVQNLREDQERFNQEVAFINEANQRFNDCIKDTAGN
jgi:prefoldin subunit 5